MANLLSIEVLNGMDLAERFRGMGKKAETEPEKAVLQAGELVGGRGRQIVHVKTGRCKASISTQLLSGSLSTKPISLTGPQVNYGAALEKMYPYMEPALNQSKEDIKRLFGDMVTTIIRGKS
jgi:hypothetical protein